MPYEVSTSVFEGPFDLLLHLITREQVDLYEVSLSKIVDAYLAELDKMTRSDGADGDAPLDLEVATEFLLIAATLIELKSRRLLPDTDSGDIDEELAIWEERDLLLARLVECKTFKDAAAALSRMFDVASASVARSAGIEERFADLIPDMLQNVTPERLRKAFLKSTAAKVVPSVLLDHVAPIRVSVEDAVQELRQQLPRRGPTTLRQLTSDMTERLDVIVSFLAVLELYKQGAVELDQASNFGDLHVIWMDEAAQSPSLIEVDSYDG